MCCVVRIAYCVADLWSVREEVEVKRRGVLGVAGVALLLAALVLVLGGCEEEPEFSTRAGGVSNLTRLELKATAAATNQPLLKVNNNSAAAEAVVIEDASTRVVVVGQGGNTTFSGSVTHSGVETFNGAVKVAATAAATATPQLLIQDVGAGAPVEVRNANATPVARISNAYDWYFEGNTLYLDADDDSSIAASSDDVISVTLGAGAGKFSIVTGNLQVGNGAADGTLNGEDAFIEGYVEVDGELELDGALDADSTSDFADTATFSKGSGTALTVSSGGLAVMNGGAECNGTLTLENDETIVNSMDGTITVTVDSSGALDIAGGNLSVGDGSPTETHNGEDAYVEGLLEVDGVTYLDGNLDADGNADFAGAVTLTQVNGAGASANPFDWTGTSGVMDGSDTLEVIDINLTSANHGSTGNVINGVSLGISSADADAEESAIYFSDGWDNDLDAATSLELSVDDAVVMTLSDPPAVNASGDLVDVTATNLGGDGSDAFVGIDLNVTNTSGSGSNTTRGIEVGLASAQADQTESGIYFTDNWDADLNAATDLVLAVDDTTVATFADPAAAGSGGDLVDVTATFGAMDGSDTSLGIDINLTGADHAGTGNSLVAIDADLTTADAQVTEQAILVDDTDWDVAVNTGEVPIVNRSMTWFEDFFGDAIPDEILALDGNDAEKVTPAIESNQEGGVLTFSTGDNNAGGCAESCEGFALGTHWAADNGGTLIFEARLHFDTDITNKLIAVGMTDNAALEMPATITSTDTIQWTADDAVLFLYDSEATTDEWFAASYDAGTDEGTGSGATGVAPVADTFQTLRIEIDSGGEDARFYVDGSLVKTITANAVTVSDLLTPVIIADTNEDAVQAVDVDYIAVWGQR